MEFHNRLFVYCCLLVSTAKIYEMKYIYSNMFHADLPIKQLSGEQLDLLLQEIDEELIKFNSRTTRFGKLPWEKALTIHMKGQSFLARRGSDNNTVSTQSQTTLIDELTTTDINTSHQSLTGSSTHSSVMSSENPTPRYDVTQLCVNQTEALINGILERQQWSLRMLDAMGKPDSNILGSIPVITWVGDFDECRAVENTTVLKGIPYNIKGKYCLATTRVNIVYLNIGFCFPNGCSDMDSFNLLKSVSSNVVSVTCQDPDRSLDTRATVVIIILSIFLALVIIGTIYDILVVHWHKISNIEKCEPFAGDGERQRLVNSKKTSSHIPGIAGKLVLSFSVYTNVSKILSTQQGAGTLTSVNGIRFITMTWVILGHTMIFAIQVYGVDNTSQWLPERLSRISFGPIYNAFPAVDTFFAMSGLLLTYLVMKELKAKNGKLNWPMFYFHRFWRLTPPYMLILMTYVSLFPYIGKGPRWLRDGPEPDYCKHSWHRNFLYVNNLFVDGYDMCMGWTWYLANDMQFYVISPLIILPLFHFHLAGVGILMAFLVGGTVACGILTAKDDLPASIFDGGNSQKFFNEYIKPWNRISPYLIGMYTGYLLYRTECKVRINKVLNLVVWTGFIALACTVLYGLHNDVNGHRLSTDIAALYTATHRFVWGACVCWVIFSCATGNGGIINTILSWKGFIPLSRLTYCAYLVHPIVIYYFLFRRQRMIHFSDTEVAYEFIGHLVLSFGVAFVASLVFESPMMALEKALLKQKESKGRS